MIAFYLLGKFKVLYIYIYVYILDVDWIIQSGSGKEEMLLYKILVLIHVLIAQRGFLRYCIIVYALWPTIVLRI